MVNIQCNNNAGLISKQRYIGLNNHMYLNGANAKTHNIYI